MDRNTVSLRLIKGRSKSYIPHDWESERAVLGGIMMDATLYKDLQSQCGLSRDDFHKPAHQELWDLMATMETPDLLSVISIATQMDMNSVERIGGMGYLAAMPNACPSVYGIIPRARALRTITVRRRLHLVGAEMMELSTDVIASADELITKAKEMVDTTSGLMSTRTWVPSPEASMRTLNAIQDRLTKTGQQGIDFGWPTITKHLGFLRPTKLWVICARPAMGKSTLANQLAYIAAKQGVGTGFIGLEMDVEEHTERTLVQLSGVNAMDVRDGNLTKHQQMELGRFADYYDTLPMWVEYAPGLTMNRLRGMAYQLRAEAAAKGFPLGLLIVDYLQLMGGMSNGQSKNDFYGDITRACKQLAGELKISIIMLSQLNRNLESRTDKRPMMSDLRESGAIEQDADVIIGIDRPEVWAQNDRPGEADIVIMKARGGMTGVIAVKFHGATLTFGDEVMNRASM